MKKTSFLPLGFRCLGAFLLVFLMLSSVRPAEAQQPAPRSQAPSAEERAARTRISEALSKGNLAAADKLLKAIPQSAAAINGSVVFEEIRACGFYPQETRLECAMDIRQNFGYGGPVGSPGSFEFVYFCVDWDNDGSFSASESVGMGIVHMHDEGPQGEPSWQYAVYRDIDPPGGPRTSNAGASTTTETNGPTRRVRAILSWEAAPTDCNFSPVWGNIVDFRIRMDPIR